MSCLFPSRIVNSRYRKYPFYLDDKPFPPDYYIKIPCGVCVECRRAKANEWKLRLECEREVSKNALFITLTFDEVSYAEFRLDVGLAVRRFFERLRKEYKRYIKHWLITELCPSSGRIHLHGVLFDVPLPINPTSWTRSVYKKSGRGKYGAFLINDGEVARTNEWLRSFWKYGNTWVDILRPESIGYIVKYMLKPSTVDPNYKPQLFPSKGLGKSYAQKNSAHHRLSDGTTSTRFMYKGFPMSLPRYLSKKIFTDDERRSAVVKQFMHPHFESSFRGVLYNSPYAYLDAVQTTLESNLLHPLTVPKQSFVLTDPPEYLIENSKSMGPKYLDAVLQNIELSKQKPIIQFNYALNSVTYNTTERFK